MANNVALDPPSLDERCLSGLTGDERSLIQSLYQLGQSHLFRNWTTPPTDNDDDNAARSTRNQRRLVAQLMALDATYSSGGGLVGYVTNARRLLDESRQGVNPLEGWIPSVPQGQTFELGTPEYQSTEAVGLEELGSVGFVLVAGGLGERLGYSSIKIGLPTELTTGTCYLQYYVEYILAVQEKYGDGKRLPLCIMTSGDTNDRTLQLLQQHQYFGMDPSQVTLVQQGQGVPALVDNTAAFEVHPDDPYRVVTKPHGHGDVHELLHRHGVAHKWSTELQLKWLVLFQDTNGLAFHTLPLMLGVSRNLNLIMNSLAVPRQAKQAIGGIAKLTHQVTGETRTINVEYNQLDPLLRATPGYEDGDVNDPQTGCSPFPGNINQLLFNLEEYVRVLQRTQGLMPEFVNPKYQDATKTAFKKPTRLECMMQDFPTVLVGDDAARVGFTSVPAELCFSPVKNATSEGAVLQAHGTQPGTAASGESDQLGAIRCILRSIGCHVDDAPSETYLGIAVVPGPAIVFHPTFACCPAEYRDKIPQPDQIRISARSTLVVKGRGVVLEQLDLDGALVIDCPPGRTLPVHRPDLLHNEGWVRVRDEHSQDEVIQMRGYRIEKRATEHISVDE